MKNKRIEDILRDAFGELDGDLGKMTEAERTEHEKARLIREGLRSLAIVPEHQLSNERLHSAILAGMTPAERIEHEQAQRIREGLLALRDVPECQLSNERLQDAILSSAVQSRRSPSWAFAGAVACTAMVIVAYQTFFAPGTGPAPVVLEDAEPVPLEQPISAPYVAIATPDPVEAVRDEVRAELNRSTTAAADGVRLSGEPSYRSGARPLDPYLMTPVSFDAETTEGIVVVDSGTTTRNGAYMATELASYGEVVIGG
ncbi:MAG: hypothetical protein WD716_12480 [Fimbriimonadaceae bacterium]